MPRFVVHLAIPVIALVFSLVGGLAAAATCRRHTAEHSTGRVHGL